MKPIMYTIDKAAGKNPRCNSYVTSLRFFYQPTWHSVAGFKDTRPFCEE